MHSYLELSDDFSLNAPYVIVAMGIFVLLIGVLACCCTVHGQPALLYLVRPALSVCVHWSYLLIFPSVHLHTVRWLSGADLPDGNHPDQFHLCVPWTSHAWLRAQSQSQFALLRTGRDEDGWFRCDAGEGKNAKELDIIERSRIIYTICVVVVVFVCSLNVAAATALRIGTRWTRRNRCRARAASNCAAAMLKTRRTFTTLWEIWWFNDPDVGRIWDGTFCILCECFVNRGATTKWWTTSNRTCRWLAPPLWSLRSSRSSDFCCPSAWLATLTRPNTSRWLKRATCKRFTLNYSSNIPSAYVLCAHLIGVPPVSCLYSSNIFSLSIICVEAGRYSQPNPHPTIYRYSNFE